MNQQIYMDLLKRNWRERPKEQVNQDFFSGHQSCRHIIKSAGQVPDLIRASFYNIPWIKNKEQPNLKTDYA
jgi:hypothetical protein